MTSDSPECGIAKWKEKRSSWGKSLVMAPAFNNRIVISDEQLQTELNRLKDYTGLQLGILKKYTPAGDNNTLGTASTISTRYVIVDAKDGTELSRSMTKSECYYELRAANEVFYKIHVLKLNRLQQRQQQEQEKEEEDKKNNDN
jgi:hypothetical protein